MYSQASTIGTAMRNRVQLITYADRLGGTIRGLTTLLQGPLAGLFGGVHLLPFYVPIDGADAGFDPTDHTEVDPRLGTWDDVAALAETLEVTADVIATDISIDSPQFEDFRRRGGRSPYAGMFLTFARVFPHGATEADLATLYRPRPGLPLTDVTMADGTRRIMWATFTDHQIDLDVSDRATIAYVQAVLDRLSASGVTTARLDAIGYAVKTAGTSCFMTPGTYRFIDEIGTWAAHRHMEVLAEIRSHHQEQRTIAGHVDWVYDFALAPLLLHGLYTGDATPLHRWFDVRPGNAVTVLDTHDGIGVLDVGRDQTDPDRAGLLDDPAIDAMVERIHANTNDQSRMATGTAASNVDVYQLNTTYYDALARDDDAYLLARAVQLFTPGVPQIYYVGLLAGTNDMDLLASTGVGRDINRHRYSRGDVERAIEQPVVRRQMALIRFRNSHPAFGGTYRVDHVGDSDLTIRWEAGADAVALSADLADRTLAITVTDDDGSRTVHDLHELAEAPDLSR